MDMHNGSHVRDIADHHDDIVSFERSSSARKAEAPKVTPAACGEGWYHDAAIAAADKAAVEARSNPYHH